MRRAFILCGAFLTCILLSGSGISLRADYKEAVAHYTRGEYEKAIQELQTDLENNPDWEFGHRLLGLCYLNLKKDAQAAAALSRAVELKSDVFSTYFGLAQAYFNLQRYRDCVTALDKGKPIAEKDKNPEASRAKLYRLRGSANYRLNNYSETITDLTQALRLSTPDWTDLTMLGVSYFSMNRGDEAIETLEKSLTLNGNQPNILAILGKAYLEKGTEALSRKEFAAAAEFLTKAGEYDPVNGYVYYNLAETYLFEKKYSDAEKTLNKAVGLLPRNAEVHQRLGLVYEKLKKWDQALKAYEQAQAINPSESLKEAIARVKNNKKSSQ